MRLSVRLSVKLSVGLTVRLSVRLSVRLGLGQCYTTNHCSLFCVRFTLDLMDVA